jgi:hypothetical protein
VVAIGAGLVTWIGLELFGRHNEIWPPQLIGFFMAGAGMLAGSLLPPLRRTSRAPSRDPVSIT